MLQYAWMGIASEAIHLSYSHLWLPDWLRYLFCLPWRDMAHMDRRERRVLGWISFAGAAYSFICWATHSLALRLRCNSTTERRVKSLLRRSWTTHLSDVCPVSDISVRPPHSVHCGKPIKVSWFMPVPAFTSLLPLQPATTDWLPISLRFFIYFITY